MFKKFTTEEVSTQNQIKSSVQRGVRGRLLLLVPLLMSVACQISRSLLEKLSLCVVAKVLELYPFLEETGVIDEILPKKEQATLAKL